MWLRCKIHFSNHCSSHLLILVSITIPRKRYNELHYITMATEGHMLMVHQPENWRVRIWAQATDASTLALSTIPCNAFSASANISLPRGSKDQGKAEEGIGSNGVGVRVGWRARFQESGERGCMWENEPDLLSSYHSCSGNRSANSSILLHVIITRQSTESSMQMEEFASWK